MTFLGRVSGVATAQSGVGVLGRLGRLKIVNISASVPAGGRAAQTGLSALAAAWNILLPVLTAAAAALPASSAHQQKLVRSGLEKYHEVLWSKMTFVILFKFVICRVL